MKIVFTNKIYFSLLFFFILLLDIYVKLNLEAIPYRFFTKPFITISLIYFFIINKTEVSLKAKYVLIALFIFLIGDLFFIGFDYMPLYITAIILFIFGKLCYVYVFSNQRVFNMTSLIPFFLACFAYMIFIMSLVVNKLGYFLFPVLLYLFSCLIVVLFASLRRGEVNNKSFLLVLVGVLIAVSCDSITVIQSFYYSEFPYHEFLTMFLYGLSQYLIVLGIIEGLKNRQEFPTAY